MSTAALLSLYVFIDHSGSPCPVLCVCTAPLYLNKTKCCPQSLQQSVFRRFTVRKMVADGTSTQTLGGWQSLHLVLGAVCFTNHTFRQLQFHPFVYSKQTSAWIGKTQSWVGNDRNLLVFAFLFSSCFIWTPSHLHIKLMPLVCLQVLLFLQAKTEEEHAATQMIARLPENLPSVRLCRLWFQKSIRSHSEGETRQRSSLIVHWRDQFQWLLRCTRCLCLLMGVLIPFPFFSQDVWECSAG